MGKSKFKESYFFLNEHFTLMTGRTNLLLYSPSTMKFYEDFYEYFNIQCEIDETENYKLTISISEEESGELYKFKTENEMVKALKEKLEERKIIGKVKKIFSV